MPFWMFKVGIDDDQSIEIRQRDQAVAILLPVTEAESPHRVFSYWFRAVVSISCSPKEVRPYDTID